MSQSDGSGYEMEINLVAVSVSWSIEALKMVDKLYCVAASRINVESLVAVA